MTRDEQIASRMRATGVTKLQASREQAAVDRTLDRRHAQSREGVPGGVAR